MSTAKRDKLRAIEEAMEAEWEAARVHEAAAPADFDESKPMEKAKYMATFPYPYMNGCLHIGHAFTVTKSEFATRYEKLAGKNALFPFGFHCTGMPIKACADKLKLELAEFGCPPQFPEDTPEAVAARQAAAEAAKAAEAEAEKLKREKKEAEKRRKAERQRAIQKGEAVAEEKKEEKKEAAAPKKAKKQDEAGDFHGRKAKVAQKTVARQWKILKSNGVPDDLIPQFVDPNVWLRYFPPIGMDDLKHMGVAVDWRRSFITTDANPFYDSFVQWQFNTLRRLEKIDFGKRYTIYSPLDGQACADHERKEGEGVIPQEYTLIKMEVVRDHADVPAKIAAYMKENPNARVFFVAGTLRPETMCGQTNCFALPGGEYGAFLAPNNEVFVCTPRAARNMAFQGLSRTPEKVECAIELDGTELIGTPLRAPLSPYDHVHVLPMPSIDPAKGTGIVTSVPSDSPDDYTNFMLFKNKPEYRKKMGIKDEWVLPYELVNIINIPEYGDCAAKTVCEELGVKGPGDHELLKQAKERTYLKGFYSGVMLIGKYAGQKVKDAKNLVRDDLIASNEAAAYAEPASLVVSRSEDECVVALLDQWYLKYGEEEWRDSTLKHVDDMEFYTAGGGDIVRYALGWMNQWACSRNFGLGTRLPWDKKYLIESLSDSTVYMAFYTVAHLLQGETLDGSKPNKYGITADQMTQGVWDHIFLGFPVPEDCKIPAEALAELRREFLYWYPMDLRVSGKDLLQNHLIFCLYNHNAIFPELQPHAFRANGHLMLDGKKMSKSTGNFITMREGVDLYSADGMRIALADAGDGLDDANFVRQMADAALLRLYAQLQWVEEVFGTETRPAAPMCEEADRALFADKVFESTMNVIIGRAESAYKRTMYREALHASFFELQLARDLYRNTCEDMGILMKRSLVERFVEVQALMLSPIAPHFCDYLWRKVLKREGFIWRDGRFPVAGPIDQEVLKKSQYIEQILGNFRQQMQRPTKKGQSASAIKEAEIVVAKQTPEWMLQIYGIVKRLVEESPEKAFPANPVLLGEVNKIVKNKALVGKMMGKARAIAQAYAEKGESALTMQLAFDERAFLEEMLPYMKSALKLEELRIRDLEGVDEKILPGQPGFAILA